MSCKAALLVEAQTWEASSVWEHVGPDLRQGRPVAQALNEGFVAAADRHDLAGATDSLIQGFQRLLYGAHALSPSFRGHY